MSERPSADRLLRALDGCVARVRRRRIAIAVVTAGVSLAAAAGLAAAWATLGPFVGLAPATARTSLLLRVAALVFVAALVLRAATRRVSRSRIAREVDTELGLDDCVAAAAAVVAGVVPGALGERVVADAAGRLDGRSDELARAFRAEPPRSVLWIARAAALLIALWVGLVALSYLVPAGGAGPAVPGVRGHLPLPGGGASAPESPDGAEVAPGADDEPTETPSTADDPAEPAAAAAEADADPATAGPLATAALALSAREVGPRDEILALVRGAPAKGLAARRGFRVDLEIDGERVGTGEGVVLVPGAAEGDHAVIRLRTLADAVPLLGPGEHEVVAILTPATGIGAAARSAPQRFRVRSDGEGGGSSGGEPPPEPDAAPEEQPEPAPSPAPESVATTAGGEQPPPPEADPLEMPETTQLSVVVPLFGDGEEVEKIGKRLVLTAGGGPTEEPTAQPLVEALPDAVRRAESAVDRVSVRERDRALVRRYFERLRRLAERVR